MREEVPLCNRKLISGLQSPVIIRTSSRWLYSTAKEEKVFINCFGSDSVLNVSTRILNGVGEIPSRDRCDLVADGYKVPARFLGSSWYPGDFGKITLPEITDIFSQDEAGLIQQDPNETLKVLEGLDNQLGTISVKEYSLESALRRLESHYQTQAKLKCLYVVVATGICAVIICFLVYRWRARVAVLLHALAVRTGSPQRAGRNNAPPTAPRRCPEPTNTYEAYDNPGLDLAALP